MELNVIQPPNKIIVVVSSGRLDTIQACEYRYFARYVLGIEPDISSTPKDKGTFEHELLRHYYLNIKEGKSIIDARAKASMDGLTILKKITLDNEHVQEGINTFIDYTNHYSRDKFTVLGVEDPFSVVIYEDNELIIVAEGKIDLRVDESGREEIYDHKTSSRKNYYDEYVNQFLLYTKVRGTKSVIVNEIIFKKGPDKFHRSILSPTKTQLDNFVVSVRDAVYTNLRCEAMNHWPRRMHACNDKYGCSYKDLCKYDIQTTDWVIQTRFRKIPEFDVLKGE